MPHVHSATDRESPLTVDCNFPGGNIILDRVSEDHVYLRQDLRDTEGHWFYWYFRVCGAAGRTLTFHFTDGDVIGNRGPAVSLDGGSTWDWLGTNAVRGNAFRFCFPQDASEVRFSFGFPYVTANLHDFLSRWKADPRVRVERLCTTQKGRDVEVVRLFESDAPPRHRILLTCRHHACEALASYVLEGMIEASLEDDPVGRWFESNTEILALPFVDKDGVEDGDQGKNRRPWDHNRDYGGESIYPSVQALKRTVPDWSQGRLRVALDLHCPYMRGDGHEAIYLVGARSPSMWEEQIAFSQALERVQSGPLEYRASDNLPFGQGWNTGGGTGERKTCSAWARELPGIWLAATIETPYAKARGKTVTIAGARAFGRDLARAVRIYLEGKSSGREA